MRHDAAMHEESLEDWARRREERRNASKGKLRAVPLTEGPHRGGTAQHGVTSRCGVLPPCREGRPVGEGTFPAASGPAVIRPSVGCWRAALGSARVSSPAWPTIGNRRCPGAMVTRGARPRSWTGSAGAGRLASRLAVARPAAVGWVVRRKSVGAQSCRGAAVRRPRLVVAPGRLPLLPGCCAGSCGASRWRSVRARLVQCLVQVRPQVLDILDADGQADGALVDAGRGSGLGGELAVRGAGRVEDERSHVAQ